MNRKFLAMLACAVATTLAPPSASADVVDDLEALLEQYNFPAFRQTLNDVVARAQQMAAKIGSDVTAAVDVAGQGVVDGALTELNLAAAAADTAAAALEQARQLQATCPAYIQATAVQGFLDWDARARRALADARSAAGNIGAPLAALRRTTRSEVAEATQAAAANVQSVVGPIMKFLDDPLNAAMSAQDLIGYLRGGLTQIKIAIAGIAQTVSSVQTKPAVSAAMSSLRAVLTATLQQRQLAQQVAAEASAALDQLKQLAASKPCGGTTGGTATGGGSHSGGETTAGSSSPSSGGTTGPDGSPAAGSIDAALFGPLAGFYLDAEQSRTEDFEGHRFGQVNGQPLVEGRKWSLSYRMLYAPTLPGALGICKRFADAVRKAGAQVLADNQRNGATMRYVGDGRELWAEIACDKDRYYLIVVERTKVSGRLDAPSISDAESWRSCAACLPGGTPDSHQYDS